MSPDELDEAIDYLENALSDLRWANRGGKQVRRLYIAKARNCMMRAEDCLDKMTAKIIAVEPT